MAYITFQDQQVKQILLNNGVGSDGEITYEQAAAVTSIGTWFRDSSITSFNELQYFTGLTSIKYTAFENCSGLTSIVIPDSVTNIEIGAFRFSGLQSIEIPDSVTNIGEGAFQACSELMSVVIGSGVTTIEKNTFSSCTSLASVTIPNTVTRIKGDDTPSGSTSPWTWFGLAGAFKDCTSLKSIVIPDSVTDIDNGVFYRSGLQSIEIPNSVTTLLDCLNSCSDLKTIILPNNLSYIEKFAIAHCSSLESIYFSSSTPPPFYNVDSTSFKDVPIPITAYVPEEVFWDYFNTYPYSQQRYFRVVREVTQPVISPSGGTFDYGQEITISASSAATVYYTIDGTEPTSASTEYTEPLILTDDCTVKAKAYANGHPSRVTTAVFYLLIRAEQPVITPSGGTVAPPQIINISAPSSAATVYYTLDGTEPTSASTEYAAPFAINESCTIKAIAYQPDVEPSFITIANFTIVKPSPLPPRPQGNVDGIHIAGITYSGTTRTETRSLTLPTPTSSDNEALVEWEYLINGDPEDLGPLGTKCKVEDTEITIHINFEYNGETYSLDKVIPVTCQVGHIEQKREQLILDNAFGVVTLQDKLNINVKGRIKYTSDNQSAIITDPSGYTLQGFTSNGNFICDIDGSYFVYNQTLINDYSTTPDPANQVYLSLRNSNNEEVDSYVIQVTYEAGAILDVKADAIRMAVQSGNTYTDGQISGVTNQISQLTITVSGITGTVSDMSTTVTGHTEQISQLQQTSSAITASVSSLSEDVSGNTASISQLQITASGITTTVSGLTDEMSELSQTVSSITINIYDELNEKTGIDVESGTITFTANNGLYVNDSNDNTRIEISPSSIGAKDSHVWNSNPVTQIAMDGFYSGTQSAHTWNGTNEIELAVSGHVLDVNQMGVQRSSFLTESLNGTDTITNGLYADVGSTLPVRIITPTANNQSFSLSKNNGFVVVKNNSPQREVQLVLPAAASSVGCRIFVKGMHDTYIKSSEDLYPCGDSVPYSQGTTGINIGNDAMCYLCDGTAWFEFKGI